MELAICLANKADFNLLHRALTPEFKAAQASTPLLLKLLVDSCACKPTPALQSAIGRLHLGQLSTPSASAAMGLGSVPALGIAGAPADVAPGGVEASVGGRDTTLSVLRTAAYTAVRRVQNAALDETRARLERTAQNTPAAAVGAFRPIPCSTASDASSSVGSVTDLIDTQMEHLLAKYKQQVPSGAGPSAARPAASVASASFHKSGIGCYSPAAISLLARSAYDSTAAPDPGGSGSSPGRPEAQTPAATPAVSVGDSAQDWPRALLSAFDAAAADSGRIPQPAPAPVPKASASAQVASADAVLAGGPIAEARKMGVVTAIPRAAAGVVPSAARSAQLPSQLAMPWPQRH